MSESMHDYVIEVGCFAQMESEDAMEGRGVKKKPKKGKGPKKGPKPLR